MTMTPVGNKISYCTFLEQLFPSACKAQLAIEPHTAPHSLTSPCGMGEDIWESKGEKTHQL